MSPTWTWLASIVVVVGAMAAAESAGPGHEKEGTRFILSGNYTPAPYEPRDCVKNMHRMPRVTGESDFNVDDGDYVVGIVMVAILFFIAGLLLLLAIFTLTLVRVCCKGKLRRKKERIESRQWFCAGLFCLAMMIVGCGFAIGGSVSMIDDIVTSTHLVDEVNDDYRAAVDLINSTLASAPSQAQLEVELNQLGFGDLFVVVNISTPNGLVSGNFSVTEITSHVYALVLDAGDGALYDLAKLSDDIYDVSEGIRELILTVETIIIILMIPSFLFISFLLVVFAVVLAKRSPPSWMGKATFCVLFTSVVLLATGVTILFGAEMAVSVLTSDFCMDPDNNVLDFFSGTTATIVNFYLTCEVPPDVLENIQDVYNAFLQLVDQVVGQIGTDEAQELLNFLESLGIIAAVEQAIVQFLFCPTLNGLYQQILHRQICFYLTEHSIYAWSGLATMLAFVVPAFFVYDQLFGVKGNFDKADG